MNRLIAFFGVLAGAVNEAWKLSASSSSRATVTPRLKEPPPDYTLIELREQISEYNSTYPHGQSPDCHAPLVCADRSSDPIYQPEQPQSYWFDRRGLRTEPLTPEEIQQAEEWARHELIPALLQAKKEAKEAKLVRPAPYGFMRPLVLRPSEFRFRS